MRNYFSLRKIANLTHTWDGRPLPIVNIRGHDGVLRQRPSSGNQNDPTDQDYKEELVDGGEILGKNRTFRTWESELDAYENWAVTNITNYFKNFNKDTNRYIKPENNPHNRAVPNRIQLNDEYNRKIVTTIDNLIKSQGRIPVDPTLLSELKSIKRQCENLSSQT